MIREELLSFIQNLDSAGKGYESWGKVSVEGIAVRESKSLYRVAADKSIIPLQTDTEEGKLLSAIFAKRKNVNCILTTRQEFASAIREEIPPILDDQAQLLGVSVKVAKDSGAASILKALNSRYAAVCPDGRCICIGGTADDAYIAAQLLEKTAKAWTEAKYIGGAKSINRLEAWAMQMYYQFKYAKEAKKNR